MAYEVEQKFPVANPAEIERAILTLGGTAQSSLEQVDSYFAHPARDFAQTDEALRIRRVGQENFVTYKGPKIDKTTKTRREIELAVEPGESGFAQLAEMLTLLGFRLVATVRKTRRPFHLRWDGRDFELALDDVASVGTFVELELVVEAEALDQAKASLASLADQLGLSTAERRSYLELQLEKSSISMS